MILKFLAGGSALAVSLIGQHVLAASAVRSPETKGPLMHRRFIPSARSFAAKLGLVGLVVVVLSTAALPASAAAATIRSVCPSGCSSTTIQGAITAAVSGDTITVAAGTYKEDVVVNKAVTITGAGAATTSIVATTGDKPSLTFITSGATVTDFTITHNYTEAELSDWKFNNNGVIFELDSTGNTLANNIISKNRNGIYVFSAQTNTISGNIITDNRTGINLTGNFTGTTISDNTISDNWTLGLAMYDASNTVDLATVTVTGNTFDQNWYGQVLVKGTTPTTNSVFTGTLNVTDNTFTDTLVTLSTSNDPSLNEPGFAAQKPVSLGGDAVKPETPGPTMRIYGTPDATLKYDGPLGVVLDDTTPAVTVTDATQPLVVVVADGVEGAGVDYSALLTGGTGILPQTTIQTGSGLTVDIPASTTVTSSDPSWDGVISAPTIVPNSSVAIPAKSGMTVTVATAIEVGAGNIGLTFDNGVRILLPGQADKLAGFVRDGTFTQITAKCSADSQTVGDALAAGGDCSISAGADLVVWTKHFTTFVAYSSVAALANTGAAQTLPLTLGAMLLLGVGVVLVARRRRMVGAHRR